MEFIVEFFKNPVVNYRGILYYGLCLVSFVLVLLITEVFKVDIFKKYFTKPFFIKHKTLTIVTFSLLLSASFTLLELLLFYSFRGINYISAIILCWCLSGQSSSIIKIAKVFLKKKGIDLEEKNEENN